MRRFDVDKIARSRSADHGESDLDRFRSDRFDRRFRRTQAIKAADGSRDDRRDRCRQHPSLLFRPKSLASNRMFISGVSGGGC